MTNSSALHSLLFELQFEELPERLIPAAFEEFKTNVQQCFQTNFPSILTSQRIEYFSTPRRLAFLVTLPASGAPIAASDRVVRKKIGPKIQQCFKQNPQTAAWELSKPFKGFLMGQGLSEVANRLATSITIDMAQEEDGQIFQLDASENQPSTISLVKEQGKIQIQRTELSYSDPALVVASVTANFPAWIQNIAKVADRTMRDGRNFVFIRPIERVLVMLDNQADTFAVLNDGDRASLQHQAQYPSGVPLFGQRPLAAVTLDHAQSYVQALASVGVIANLSARVEHIASSYQAITGSELERSVSQQALANVVHAVEHPESYKLSIPAAFKDLPALLTHQVCKGQYYLPWPGRHDQFVLVSNAPFGLDHDDEKAAENFKNNVIEGNQKVIFPRLSDAEFFHHLDRDNIAQGKGLQAHESIVLHAFLGTIKQKNIRVAKVLSSILETIGQDTISQSNLEQMVNLFRFDRGLAVITEYPELEGNYANYLIEQEYLDASIWQEDNEIKRVFSQSCMLIGTGWSKESGDQTNWHPVALLSLMIDRLDTLICFFMRNPKLSNKDPYGLRGMVREVCQVLDYWFSKRSFAQLHQSKILLQTLLDLVNQQALDFTPSDQVKADYLEQLTQAILTKFDSSYVPDILVNPAPEANSIQALIQMASIKYAFDTSQSQQTVPAELVELIALNKRLKKSVTSFKSSDNEAANDNEILPQESDLVAFIDKLQEERVHYQHVVLPNQPQDFLAVVPLLEQYFDKVFVNHQDAGIRVRRQQTLKKLYQLMSDTCDFATLTVKSN